MSTNSNRYPNRRRAINSLSRANTLVRLSIIDLYSSIENENTDTIQKPVIDTQKVIDKLEEAIELIDVATNEAIKIKEAPQIFKIKGDTNKHGEK